MKPIDRKLLTACETGSWSLVEQYLQKGADPNVADSSGRTPFLLAARKGHIPSLDLLARHGADIHHVDSNLHNALFLAVKNREYKTVHHLLAHYPIAIDTQDRLGVTPFLLAAENGDHLILDLLAQYGANIHHVDRKRQNAIHHAIRCDRHYTARHLINCYNLDPNTQDDWGHPPLFLAIMHGHIHSVDILIENGANPHITNIYGENAVHFAARWCQNHILNRLIVRYGVNPHIEDTRGYFPIFIAAKLGNIPAVHDLTRHGANPLAINQKGETILHYAALQNEPDIVENLIVRYGIDCDTKDHKGYTPFIIASGKGHLHVMNTLASLGANPFLTDNERRNALHHAVINKRHDAIRFLITHYHFDPNTQDEYGDTPLIIATRLGLLKTAKILVQLGASPYICNRRGENAITIAKEKSLKIARLHQKPSAILL